MKIGIPPPKKNKTKLLITTKKSSHTIPLYSCLFPLSLIISNSWQQPVYFPRLQLFSFQECYIIGIIQHWIFWDWLFSLSMKPLRSIEILSVLYFFINLSSASTALYKYITVCLSIHLLETIWIVSSFGQL